MPQAIKVCEGKYTWVLPEKPGEPIKVHRYENTDWLEFTVSTPGFRAIDALLTEALEMKFILDGLHK